MDSNSNIFDIFSITLKLNKLDINIINFLAISLNIETNLDKNILIQNIIQKLKSVKKDN